MRLVWHGTASVEMISSSGRILFDPFVPLRGSVVRVRPEDFAGIGDIFLTHGHLDHIVSIPELVRREPSARVYCTKTPYETLLGKGVPEKNLRRIEYGQCRNAGGFAVRVYHGRHAELPGASFSRVAYMLRSPHRGNLPTIIRENRICRENDETVFYQIEAEGKSVSLMGSLNLREEIAYPENADLLILPYNGWEDNFPPAVGAIRRLKPKRVLLDHYDDTFPPVTRPLDLSPILRAYAGLAAPMELGRTEEV